MFVTRLNLPAPPGRKYMAELQICFPDYWYLAWTSKTFMCVGKNWRLNDQ